METSPVCCQLLENGKDILLRELDFCVVQELNKVGVLTDGEVEAIDQSRKVEGADAGRSALVQCLKVAVNRNGDAIGLFEDVLQRKQHWLYHKLGDQAKCIRDVTLRDNRLEGDVAGNHSFYLL